MRHTLVSLCVLVMGGCAWGPGQGFAVVEPTVRASYSISADREAGDGYARLASDYQVRMTTASLQLSGIALLASSGESSGFDPAHPPEGYSLCHGGHCHRADGALVPYEQVAAELSGGSGASAVVTLSVPESFDLLSSQSHPATCSPECALPEARISQGRWSLTSMVLKGSVRDGKLARFTGERNFELTLATTDATQVAVLGPVDLLSDRTEVPETKVDLELPLTAAFWDAVDWK